VKQGLFLQGKMASLIKEIIMERSSAFLIIKYKDSVWHFYRQHPKALYSILLILQFPFYLLMQLPGFIRILEIDNDVLFPQV
jgi:hypothetical protein